MRKCCLCQGLDDVDRIDRRWLPSEPLIHCIKITGAKILLLDAERADRLHSAAGTLHSAGTNSVIVMADAPANKWPGFQRFTDVLNIPGPDPRNILDRDVKIEPEDNATIIFTSGTCVLVTNHMSLL
jgi:long-subunit acyl-CoA synthetase (AMP-forming)